jgi:hypothetical protein
MDNFKEAYSNVVIIVLIALLVTPSSAAKGKVTLIPTSVSLYCSQILLANVLEVLFKWNQYLFLKGTQA